ncbi:MAG: serine protein kinase RIO [Nitrososphaerota archaeon]|nr:serine protein kinase RIO [Nitrososphaerota archaeon]
MESEERIEKKASRDLFKMERESRYLRKRSEETETLEEVFDRSTLMTLYSMMNRGVFGYLNGVVKAGKEGRVYWGVRGKEDLAVKIFYTSTASFKKRSIYIAADPRFSGIERFGRQMIYEWVKKEFRNLRQAEDAGVNVPHPFHAERNVLVMKFIGKGGVPAPTLAEAPAVTAGDYASVVRSIVRLFREARLVHGDLSEFNVFKLGSKTMLFDFASAVDRSHPMARDFLLRDIRTVGRFFEKRGVRTLGEDEVLRRAGAD